MIINIKLTEVAIEYLIRETGLEHEEAEEVAQMVINLCEKSGSPTPRYPKERKLFQEIRELIARHKDDSGFETFVQRDALKLESSLEQFFDLGEDPEEDGSEDRLRRAARFIVMNKRNFIKGDIDGLQADSIDRLAEALEESEK